MASGPVPGMVLQPRVNMMIISVARHKISIEDNVSTCQLPLESINHDPSRPSISLYAWLKPEALENLKTMIEARLRISLAHMSIVWYMIESGQLATVNDRESLCAAIMDHINFRRHTVQLHRQHAQNLSSQMKQSRPQTNNSTEKTLRGPVKERCETRIGHTQKSVEQHSQITV
ncbi:hypothetical protein M436DRAFT_63851 [Aureobasidium namibiae CBS 147.97]|uniref:Uncharacterized protein n=1 Tax=Aureobasidium namibiae CBS 147.97 TaxID=1043004 RepID=A0A074WKC1_9PEZI